LPADKEYLIDKQEGSPTEIEKKLKILWDFYLGLIEKFKVLIIY